jgi:hypothetical protein
MLGISIIVAIGRIKEKKSPDNWGVGRLLLLGR